MRQNSKAAYHYLMIKNTIADYHTQSNRSVLTYLWIYIITKIGNFQLNIHIS